MPDRLVAPNRFVSDTLSFLGRGVLLAGLLVFLAGGLCAQDTQKVFASSDAPNAPSSTVTEEPSSSSLSEDSQSRQPGPDPELGELPVPERSSAQTPVAKEQPKRILYIIPNYRAVSADATVPPLDAMGKFKLFRDDSFDYSTFIYVGLLAGIGMAERNVPQFGDGADAFSRYYWHIFADQALGNSFTEFILPAAFKQDPRYFTKGQGGVFNRTVYAVSRLVVTRTDSGSSQINYSEIIGNGAAAGISGLYYPAPYRTWTKTGQRWGQQLALDGAFNVVKEFWPDIRHSVLRQKN